MDQFEILSFCKELRNENNDRFVVEYWSNIVLVIPNKKAFDF